MDGGMIIGGNMKALILAILFLLIAPPPATAGEPREERILRIEASMHTEAIVRIGVDREERCSERVPRRGYRGEGTGHLSRGNCLIFLDLIFDSSRTKSWAGLRM